MLIHIPQTGVIIKALDDVFRNNLMEKFMNF